MLSRSTAALLTAIALLIAVAVLGFQPWLAQVRPVVVSTPGLAAIPGSPGIAVAAGARACLSPVRLDPAFGRAAFVLRAAKPPAGPLRLTLVAYDARGRPDPRVYSAAGIANVPAGGEVTTVFSALRHPPRTVVGRMCLTNNGRRQVELVGTTDARVNNGLTVSVDGAPVPAGVYPSLTLLQDHERSRGAIAGLVARNLATMTGGSVPAWLVWLIAAGVILVLPAAIFLLFGTALRADDRRLGGSAAPAQPEDAE